MLLNPELLKIQLPYENAREAEFLQSLLAEYPWLGKTELVEVGDRGWLIHLLETPRRPNATILSLDFDDFLVDSLSAKAKLVQRLTSYLVAQQQMATQGALTQRPPTNSDLAQNLAPLAAELAKLSDTFARWSNGNDQEKTYHSEAQAAALAWGLEQLVERFQQKGDALKTLKQLSLTLEQINPDLTAANPRLPLDWFFIGNKLITPTYPESQLQTSQRLIMETLVKPDPQIGVISGVSQLITEQSFTPMLFSGGAPPFQLMKIGEFLKTHPNLRPAMIALAKSDKGSFLQEATSEILNKDVDKSPTSTRMIHFDDLPLAATALAEAAPQLKKLELAVARFKFATGKASNLDWQPTQPQAIQFDLSQVPTHSPDFAQRFINEIDWWIQSVFRK